MRQRLFTLFILLLFVVPSENAEAKSLIKRFRYGNFCGSGHGNNSPKPPIDALDKACKAHDLCCKAIEFKSGVKICDCHCDAALRRSADRFLRTKRARKSAKARRAALGIASLYRLHACFCRRRICRPKIKCRRKRKCTRKFRKKICIRVPRCSLTKVCKRTKVPGQGGRCLLPACKTKKICKRFLGKKFCFKGVVCK